MTENTDHKVVQDFGSEWKKFDQTELSEQEHRQLFECYFQIFPWASLPQRSQGFDLGCGSGRWAALVAPKVGELHCIDPSQDALDVAKRRLANAPNCRFHTAGVDGIPLADNSMDFGYSLGVLHHVPDTEAGLRQCVLKLKPGAPILIYLYYAFDNRPVWFQLIWRLSDYLRKVISRLPFWLKYPLTQIIAALVYFPLTRLSLLLERLGLRVDNIPLSTYRRLSFYTMRTDALDRFGTRLEQRFTRQSIESMMQNAGLQDIRFSSSAPYWCAVGFKR